MDEASRAALMEEMAKDWATGGCYLTRHAALLELKGLQDEKSIEPRNVQFLRFCEHVVTGYGGVAGMSDQQIAEAAETPALMRYLIGALASYETRVGHVEKSTTVERRLRLAEAFSAEDSEPGGDRYGKWTLERQARALNSYVGKLHSFEFDEIDEIESRGTEKAQQKAVCAAYEDIFGHAYKHRPEKKRSNLEGLLRVLHEHGHASQVTPQTKLTCLA